MTNDADAIRAAFRLNLEQQKKRAKDLLKAARAGDASALSKISSLRLADAQHAIAHDLGFSAWHQLKTHIASLDRARHSIAAKEPAPDTDVKTLHLRCGSDIKATLQEAGFGGDFLEVSYPYCHGPVTTTPDHLEREARFIVESAGPHMQVTFDGALTRRINEERDLAASGPGYARIVLWMEHDCFDQLVLVRCLAHYASQPSLPILELIGINHFPGTIRFIGLGQLPVEALRLLWSSRNRVTPAQLALANDSWKALTRDDPRSLAALMRTGCPNLPDLATALHRLLQELPGVHDGLGLTERLILQCLAENGMALYRLFAELTKRDPLPYATDFMLLNLIDRLMKISTPLVKRSSTGDKWRDEVTLTDAGRAVLRGDLDFISLQPSARWIGGVEICAGKPTWRWDESKRDVILT